MIMDPSTIFDKRCCYDAHLFLEPPAHDIICCVDGRVAKDGVRSRACGHVFGMQCILEYLVNHDTCPKCGVSLDCTMLEPSEIIRTHILRSTIRCPTGPSHCEWQGVMAEMMVHLHSSQCGVPRTRCPFCHEIFDTHVFESQHKAECPAALVLCPHCDDAIERRFIVQHKQECAAEVAKINKEKQNNNNNNNGRTKQQQATSGAKKSGTVTSSRVGNANARRSSTVSSSAVGNSAAKKSSSTINKKKTEMEQDEDDSGLTPSTSQKFVNNNNNNKVSQIQNQNKSNRRPSSAAPAPVVANNNNNINGASAGRPLSSSGLFHQNQQQQHELSIRSPIGSAATRRLLDESAFQQPPYGSAYHQNHQFNNHVRALSPGQLQQWRSMTASTVSTQNNNNQLNNSQLISYSASGLSSSQQHHQHQLESFQQDISAMIQELSRVGQKCQNLEIEVETLKRSNAVKDGQINILSMQLKKVEEQVIQLINNKNNKSDRRPSAEQQDRIKGEEDFTIEGDASSLATKKAKNLMMPRRPTSSSSQQQHQQNPIPSSVASTAAPNYTSRNKNYSGIGNNEDENNNNKNAVYKLPSDVAKEVRRTSHAENVTSLVKGGATPQTNNNNSNRVVRASSSSQK